MYSLAEINKAFINHKIIKEKEWKLYILKQDLLSKIKEKNRGILKRVISFIFITFIFSSSIFFNIKEAADIPEFLLLYIILSSTFFAMVSFLLEVENRKVESRLDKIKETYNSRINKYNKKTRDLNPNTEKYFNQLKVLERRGQLHLIQDELIDIVINNKQKQLNVVVDSHSDKINHLIKLEEDIKIGTEIHNE